MPLFAFKRGSGLGARAREARRVAGAPDYDAARFVAKARQLSEVAEKPATVANDVRALMHRCRCQVSYTLDDALSPFPTYSSHLPYLLLSSLRPRSDSTLSS